MHETMPHWKPDAPISKTTCIECGVKESVDGPEGMVYKTLMKPEVKTFSCGCQAWVDTFDGCYHFKPCTPDCALYFYAVQSAREMGKNVTQVKDQ